MLTQLLDHPLHADYRRRLQAGMEPNLAKLTLARRIAAIVLSMWKHEEVYDAYPCSGSHRARGGHSANLGPTGHA